MTSPLTGVRVVEIGSMYAAPTAGRMLRDFGADVVKVEDPSTGDFARQWQPAHNGLAIGFARLNAGKRSVGVDLRTEEGRAVVLGLIESADVVIENFRPGRLEAWGMGYQALAERNPRLVLTRVSGFGQTGPYRERPGFGTVAETLSGYAFLNGWPHTPPTAPPFGFADSIAGISAAFGTAMALYRREVTGVGSEVDVALYEPLMFILGDAVLNYTASGNIMRRQGNASGAASPRGIYEAGDGGWLSIAGSNQTIAMRLFDAMGRPDLKTDERYATNVARMANNESLQEIVIAWVKSRPRDEILAILDEYEVVAAAVNDASDIAADPHFTDRTLVELANTVLGPAMVPGPVLHMRGTERPTYDGVPAVGEHTREVLSGELGMADAELARLAEAGVIMPDLAEMRHQVAAGNVLCAAGPDVETEEVSLGGVRTRIYHGAPDRTLVWCHGGGWVTGDLDYSDELCRFLAHDAKCTVVSVDYRLAPEHPYPAALDDARTVLSSLDGLVAVGGDSAGGNLAAVCALEHRLAFQVLVYPVTDHDFTRPSYRRDDLPMGAETVRWFWDNYVPDVSIRDRPDISPLRATLTGLPPAHIVVAGNDLLHDEGIAYADSLRVAGVPVTVTDYPSQVHGFFRLTGADQAARAAVPELTNAVGTLFDRAAARTK